MDLENLDACIESIAKTEKKYHSDAYRFTIMTVGSLIRMRLKEEGPDAHIQIDQNEHLQWIKLYGWYNYGMLTKKVFNRWGLKTGFDFIEIVKQLIHHKILNKASFKTRYSPSYVVAGFDFADFEKEDMCAAYYPI